MAGVPDKAAKEARPPTATGSVKEKEPANRPLSMGESLRSVKSVKSNAASHRISGGTVAKEESDDDGEKDGDEEEDKDDKDNKVLIRPLAHSGQLLDIMSNCLQHPLPISLLSDTYTDSGALRCTAITAAEVASGQANRRWYIIEGSGKQR
jgi:hypothetical protein